MNTTSILPLPVQCGLQQFEKQARELAAAGRRGREALKEYITQHFPVFLHLREERKLIGEAFTGADAQFVVARSYGFESWAKLAEFTARMHRPYSEVLQFESAVNAIVTGDIATLGGLLHSNPELVHLRSMRVHHATLLHYTSANGVENYRQHSPGNAVAIARMLLEAGAEVDAAHPTNANMGTTLGLVATSCHPHRAGVQIGLLDTLYNAGAAVDGVPGGWQPLMAALANARPEAAAWLAGHGARMSTVAAAGLGRMDLLHTFFDKDGRLKSAHPPERLWHVPDEPRAQLLRAFIYACIYGHTEVAAFLIDKGVDPGAQDDDKYTGLHWAAHGGHVDTVRFLLLKKAPLEVKNAYDGTVLSQVLWSAANKADGWGGNRPGYDYTEIIELLLVAGAVVEPGTVEWLAGQDQLPASMRERMIAAFEKAARC